MPCSLAYEYLATCPDNVSTLIAATGARTDRHAQVKRLESKVEREKIVLAVLPELSLQVLELTRERGRITVQLPWN